MAPLLFSFFLCGNLEKVCFPLCGSSVSICDLRKLTKVLLKTQSSTQYQTENKDWQLEEFPSLCLLFSLKLCLFLVESQFLCIHNLVFQARHGFQGTARCRGWTTTSSAWETSGSWRRVGFSWRVELMMVRDEMSC